jgi:fimbrial isopeptide formation D2 family protein
VTASGGNISNFQIKDTLPNQLEYVNYTVVTSNGMTVSLQSVLGQLLTWNVDGTLLQNQSVVIELTTRVITLPATLTGIQNIACVWYTNIQKDCDDAFIPIGKLVIDKTLISPPSGGVSQVGEEVTWKITVTASGGDVSNFEIKDYLPDQLAYDSYMAITVPNGISLSGPTILGQILTWKATGTLPQNQSIILEVTTKVKSLPSHIVSIKNVACVGILTGD